MSELRSIDSAAFSAGAAPLPGAVPILDWLEIGRLRIDETYQRKIGKMGATTIRKIIASFRWSKFSPVIVAPIEGGQFAIIDGQHRATAAAACGFDKVPCQIVVADTAEQAAAFAAVNGAVTQMTSLQLFHARVAAGDDKALQLARVCAAASVVVLRYPLAEKFLKPGETLAPKILERNLVRYGEATLIAALQCITGTVNNRPGMVRASIVSGLCEALARLPEWREAGEALLLAMEDFDLEDAFDRIARRSGLVGGVAARMADAVALHLRKRSAPKIESEQRFVPAKQKPRPAAPVGGAVPFRPAARRAVATVPGDRDASSLVFDDPPPGRSALDQKQARGGA